MGGARPWGKWVQLTRARSPSSILPKHRPQHPRMFLKFLSTREDSLRMNPYRPIIRNKSTVLCLNCQSKRWVSHDKSELTPDGIRRRIQSGLGENVKLSEDGKELHTKYGSLPTSPIFDPAWVKSHQRERKPAVNKENKLNRFRKKLVNNPYGMLPHHTRYERC